MGDDSPGVHPLRGRNRGRGRGRFYPCIRLPLRQPSRGRDRRSEMVARSAATGNSPLRCRFTDNDNDRNRSDPAPSGARSFFQPTVDGKWIALDSFHEQQYNSGMHLGVSGSFAPSCRQAWEDIMTLRRRLAPVPFQAVPHELCAAKTTATGEPGLSVPQHGRNAAAVATVLRDLLPGPVRRLVGDFAVPVAAVHDVGKVSPGFQAKIGNPALGNSFSAGLEADHARIGAAAVNRFLNARAEPRARARHGLAHRLRTRRFGLRHPRGRPRARKRLVPSP